MQQGTNYHTITLSPVRSRQYMCCKAILTCPQCNYCCTQATNSQSLTNSLPIGCKQGISVWVPFPSHVAESAGGKSPIIMGYSSLFNSGGKNTFGKAPSINACLTQADIPPMGL